MAAGRTLKSLIGRRRRAEDEGEDEDEPVLVEDSQSEGSVVSEPEADDDGEGDGGSPSQASAAGQGSVGPFQKSTEAAASGMKRKKARKPRKKASKKSLEATSVSQMQPEPSFKAMADTDAMMNGLRINEQDQAEENTVDFESMSQNGTTATRAPAAPNGHAMTPLERQRREHEDYKKKRDSDPAFIPNRGNFFMHDTRGQPNGQAPPPRGAWQGRGRGRTGANVGGPFSPANQVAHAERAAEQPWKHDLHEVINNEPRTQEQATDPAKLTNVVQDQYDTTRLAPKPTAPRNQGQHRALSFDTATLVGKAKVRVMLPGMKAPITFSDVPVNAYIRLPGHRPPLRRDKPVRVFVPGHTQRYIFPATDRSFIFIPRQMRPNQQGFHRGHYQRSIGGYGYSSRRTSMYGGSIYSPSVAQSRRSSMAGTSRENAFSPVGSFVGLPPNRPVVRLPHAVQHYSAASTPGGPLSGQHTPTNVPVLHTYPLPQQPQFQGTPTTTVHQPRPQKQISVNDIESPAMLQQTPAEPQPFQNQLPAHMNEPQPSYQQPPPHSYFSPRQQYQYLPPQPQIGTPLSGIPEQAMQQPPFQSPPYGQPPYYAQYPAHSGFYYPTQPPHGYSQMPMYMVPPPPQGYMMPHQGPPMPAQQPPPQSVRPPSSGEQQDGQTPSGMVAHESNGMVFYVPASEAQQSEQYQPAESFVPSYAMPGLPPPTPAPDDPMASYYYPQMPHSGMQEVGTALYYPAQQ